MKYLSRWGLPAAASLLIAGLGFSHAVSWEKLLFIVGSIVSPWVLALIERNGKTASYQKVALIVKGLIGKTATEYPNWKVALVLEQVMLILVQTGIVPDRASAESAVRAVQVELGLPTGTDAESMVINDFWTGSRKVPTK
jgi:hypothetical protein